MLLSRVYRRAAKSTTAATTITNIGTTSKRTMATSVGDGFKRNLEKIQAINPATEELIREFPFMSNDEVDRRVKLADDTYHKFKETSFGERRKIMHSVADELEKNKQEYAKLMTMEMGKTLRSAVAEVEKCTFMCRYFADNAADMLRDEIVHTEAKKSLITYQPMGPLFQLAPFNFPFWQVIRFVAPAIMAGNTTLIRHGHSVPLSAEGLQKVFDRAGVPEGIFQMLFIDHDAVSRIIADQRIRGVTFTGSNRVGSIVASQAGKHLKKSVMELGGSDALIVCKDADLDLATSNACIGRTQNSGQTCIAAKRIIVVKDVIDEFTQKYVAKMKALKFGDPMDPSTDFGPLARADLRDGVHAQTQRTIAQGGKLLLGGEIPNQRGYFYPATVLGNVRPGMTAFEEEIFGPVASIVEAQDEDDAVRLANMSQYGLGGSVFTRDLEKGEKLARRLDCGLAFVNGFVKSDPRLPFGGVKNSGFGRECGEAGIKEWVNIKTLCIS